MTGTMTGTTTWLSTHHLWAQPSLARHRPAPAPPSPRLVGQERVLVRDTSHDGTQCVATERALYWRTDAPASQWSRAGWASVDQVGWSPATHTMTLLLTPAPLELRFPDHPRLVELAAERVAACHLLSRRVRVSNSCNATVAACRDPHSGEVSWTVRFDPSCDTGDPGVTRAVDEAVHELRSQTGC